MAEVSIITPCYNSSNTIYKTLESIRNQSFKDFEAIIIDDFSSDNTLEIIKSFVSKDSRFRVYKMDKNSGVVKARNHGIKHSQGRFIAFLDSDDLWKPKFLELSLKTHYKDKPGLTHAPFYRFFSYQGKFIGQEYYPPSIVNTKNILKRNYMLLSTVIVDTKIIGKFTFPNLRPEDYFLWINLVKKNIYSKSIESFQAYSRISKDQRSSNKIKAFFRLRKFYFQNEKLNFFMKNFYFFSWIIENLKMRFSKRFIMKEKNHREIY